MSSVFPAYRFMSHYSVLLTKYVYTADWLMRDCPETARRRKVLDEKLATLRQTWPTAASGLTGRMRSHIEARLLPFEDPLTVETRRAVDRQLWAVTDFKSKLLEIYFRRFRREMRRSVTEETLPKVAMYFFGTFQANGNLEPREAWHSAVEAVSHDILFPEPPNFPMPALHRPEFKDALHHVVPAFVGTFYKLHFTELEAFNSRARPTWQEAYDREVEIALSDAFGDDGMDEICPAQPY